MPYPDLHDDSVFPWGKHKGKLMKDIPANYWEWFMTQDWREKHTNLVDYVRANRVRIEEELDQKRERRQASEQTNIQNDSAGSVTPEGESQANNEQANGQDSDDTTGQAQQAVAEQGEPSGTVAPPW